MRLFKKYKVRAWKYEDKYFTHIYKSDKNYISCVLNKEVVDTLEKWFIKGEQEYIKFIDLDKYEYIVKHNIVNNIQFEHRKNRFSKEYKTEYDAQTQVAKLKDEEWIDVEIC